MRIRDARAEDRDALYEVCLWTGDSGQDANERYDDPHLLGHVYVGPYLLLEPALALVLDDGGTAGYVLGASDTVGFERRCGPEGWSPPPSGYPGPPARPGWAADAGLCHLIP